MRLSTPRLLSCLAVITLFGALGPACIAAPEEPAHDDAAGEDVAEASQALLASFSRQTAFNWGNGVTNVFTGDFDGDGKWDIGVTGTAAQGDRNWYILYGDGKGNFGRQTVFSWGNGVTNVFTGDFDGDGKWDIGVTGTAEQGDRNWYILHGYGNGSFGDQGVYNWGNGVTNVFTGDFDGDHKWDLGVTGTANQGDRNWYIRYNDACVSPRSGRVNLYNYGLGKYLSLTGMGSYWPYDMTFGPNRTPVRMEETAPGSGVYTFTIDYTPGTCADGYTRSSCVDSYRLCAGNHSGYRWDRSFSSAWGGTSSRWNSSECQWTLEDLGCGNVRLKNPSMPPYVSYLNCWETYDCVFTYDGSTAGNVTFKIFPAP